jgi:hypothetical protein
VSGGDVRKTPWKMEQAVRCNMTDAVRMPWPQMDMIEPIRTYPEHAGKWSNVIRSFVDVVASPGYAACAIPRFANFI